MRTYTRLGQHTYYRWGELIHRNVSTQFAITAIEAEIQQFSKLMYGTGMVYIAVREQYD